MQYQRRQRQTCHLLTQAKTEWIAAPVSQSYLSVTPLLGLVYMPHVSNREVIKKNAGLSALT